MKYINQATERLKTMPQDSDRELTVLEKLLISDPDPKTAMVMALDMMGAGIDTVTNSMKIPSRGAQSSLVNKEMSYLLLNLNVLCRVLKSPPLNCILGQLNIVFILQPYLFEANSIPVFIPSSPETPEWNLPFNFSISNIL
jgi:hypothetical protein